MAEEKFAVLVVRFAVAFAVRVIVVVFVDATVPKNSEFEVR